MFKESLLIPCSYSHDSFIKHSVCLNIIEIAVLLRFSRSNNTRHKWSLFDYNIRTIFN